MNHELITKLLDQLLAQTYTKAEAVSRLQALKELVLVQLFGTPKEAKPLPNSTPLKTASTGEETVPHQQTPWIVSMGTDIYKNFTRDNVYPLFNALEEEIKKIEALVVYVPMEIPESEISQIGLYLRQNFGKNFMMELKLDPGLLAGAAFVWKGVYKDYSIHKKVSDQKERILAMMKEYTRKEK